MSRRQSFTISALRTHAAREPDLLKADFAAGIEA